MRPPNRHPLAVLLRCSRLNRHGYLTLAASVEGYRALDSIPILWVPGPRVEDLFHALTQAFEQAARIVAAYSFMTRDREAVRREVMALGRHPRRQSLFLLAGGPHPTGDPKGTLCLGFDAVCLGEGEEAFPELLMSLLAGKPPTGVPGLYLRSQGKFQNTGRRSRHRGLEAPPLPRRNPRFGPIEISRGCPHGCKYCQTPSLKGRVMRHRSLDLIVDTVRHMATCGKNDVRFITPNALAYGSEDGLSCNEAAMERLLTSVRWALPRTGRIFLGSFPSEVRPEFVTHENMRLIHELCHNRQIVLGAQSGDTEMLEVMRRRHDVEAVDAACEIISMEGLTPVVDFMLGLPGERPDQMIATLNFIERLSRLGARAHLHHFMPLPGTPWASRAPTPLPTGVRRRVERLVSAGRIFGQWKTQGRRT